MIREVRVYTMRERQGGRLVGTDLTERESDRNRHSQKPTRVSWTTAPRAGEGAEAGEWGER